MIQREYLGYGRKFITPFRQQDARIADFIEHTITLPTLARLERKPVVRENRAKRMAHAYYARAQTECQRANMTYSLSKGRASFTCMRLSSYRGSYDSWGTGADREFTIGLATIRTNIFIDGDYVRSRFENIPT